MREVIFIQFTSVMHSMEQIGLKPILNNFYQLIEINDSIEYEQEDDDGETEVFDIDAIRIRLPNGRQRLVIKQNIEYNLITMKVDETSQLFR